MAFIPHWLYLVFHVATLIKVYICLLAILRLNAKMCKLSRFILRHTANHPFPLFVSNLQISQLLLFILVEGWNVSTLHSLAAHSFEAFLNLLYAENSNCSFYKLTLEWNLKSDIVYFTFIPIDNKFKKWFAVKFEKLR